MGSYNEYLYRFQAQVKNNSINFTVFEIKKGKLIYDSQVSISCKTEESLSGCIGFTGIGNGVTLYNFGVSPLNE